MEEFLVWITAGTGPISILILLLLIRSMSRNTQLYEKMESQIRELEANQIPQNRFGRPQIQKKDGQLFVEDDDGNVTTIGM